MEIAIIDIYNSYREVDCSLCGNLITDTQGYALPMYEGRVVELNEEHCCFEVCEECYNKQEGEV